MVYRRRTRFIANNKCRSKRGRDTEEQGMIEKILGAVRGFGSANGFGGYLSNLIVDDADDQAPTIEEARNQYQAIVNERATFVGRF